MEPIIHVIGAGLAGVEATHYLIRHGLTVHLYEQRPQTMTPAHHTGDFAELVCSNSLKSDHLDNACGLLKEEMRHMDSLTMAVARETAVPAGQSLSVDRTLFAAKITALIKGSDRVIFHSGEVTEIPEGIVIIATGPLTSEGLLKALKKLTGAETLSFVDASAPILEKSAVDFSVAYMKSRYDQGDASYINCPFTKEQYTAFVDALVHAERVKLHDFEIGFFEGCMPVEAMALRGPDTLRYGPLKPKGLERTPGERPYAVAQLRQDNVAGDLYNLVGFQTNLTYPEQRRVFRMIPGLANASFVRYGLMHRNTYVKAPLVLQADLSLKAQRTVFIAGQLSGVEGYVESAATGLLAGVYAARIARGQPILPIPPETMLGSLVNYITRCVPENFAPMNANYGIMAGVHKDDREAAAQRALAAVDQWWRTLHE